MEWVRETLSQIQPPLLQSSHLHLPRTTLEHHPPHRPPPPPPPVTPTLLKLSLPFDHHYLLLFCLYGSPLNHFSGCSYLLHWRCRGSKLQYAPGSHFRGLFFRAFFHGACDTGWYAGERKLSDNIDYELGCASIWFFARGSTDYHV